MTSGDRKVYKLEEVAGHNKLEDCWLVMFGKVTLFYCLSVYYCYLLVAKIQNGQQTNYVNLTRWS